MAVVENPRQGLEARFAAGMKVIVARRRVGGRVRIESIDSWQEQKPKHGLSNRCLSDGCVVESRPEPCIAAALHGCACAVITIGTWIILPEREPSPISYSSSQLHIFQSIV